MPFRKMSSYALLCPPFAILVVACGDLDSSPVARTDQPLVKAVPAPLVVAPDPVATRSLRGVQKRLEIDRTGGSLVELSDGKTVDPAAAAERIFAQHRQVEHSLESVGDAVYGDVETREEFVETQDSLMLIAQTTLVVSDPDRLRAQVPGLAGYFDTQTSADFDTLSPPQQKAIESLLERASTLADDHPLLVAAKKGKQSFLDALGRGVGDLVLTTSVRIPKEPLKQEGGQWLTPQTATRGLDFSRSVPLDAKFHADFSPTDAGSYDFSSSNPSWESESGPLFEIGNGEPSTSGEDHSVRRFINGFTLGDIVEHELTWSFTGGSFRIGVYAWYGVGLRVPIKMSGNMTPTEISVTSDDHDAEVDFESDITIEVLDADEDFYERAGMPSDLLFDGQEIVFEAGAHAEVELHTPIVNIEERFPRYPFAVDKSQDHAPPFDPDCGTECGVYVWLPASATNTQVGINVLGAQIVGTAQLGANIGGTGTVDVTYESLFDGGVIESERVSSGERRSSHQLSFSQPGERRFRTTLPRLEEHGSASYGYQVGDVDYVWDIVITPAVKGNITVDAWPFFNLDYSLGPYDINALALRPPDVTLGTHSGTAATQSVVEGEKTWRSAINRRGETENFFQVGTEDTQR